MAERAAAYAAAFGAEDEARLAGLLHDLGKYGNRFLARLRGEARGLDHWSVGVWAACTRYEKAGLAVALAIQGHHIGLQQASVSSFRALEPQVLVAARLLAKILGDLDTRGAAAVVPALQAALATGAPLTLARIATAAPPRVDVPAPLRDLGIASGCAADYDRWLTGVSA